MSKLSDMRFDSFIAIAIAAGTGGFATFAPTPVVETPKQIVLGFADIGMCVYIWKTYFKEQISEQAVLEKMGTAGIVALAAGGAGYIIAKGATGLLNEALNALTLPGWVTSGLVAASGTVTLGLAWMWFCDGQYRKTVPAKALKS